MDISTLWEAMSNLEKVYWIVAFPSSLIFLLLMIMTIFGGDGDTNGDADASIVGDHGIDFQFISVKNLVAFCTVFAWSGIACLKGEVNSTIAIVISIVSGLSMMFLMSSIYYLFGKLAENGTMKIQTAVGKQGEVYLTIPANKDGYGKVQINVQGALRTLDAMTSDTEEIKTNALVRVINVIDNHILVVTKNT